MGCCFGPPGRPCCPCFGPGPCCASCCGPAPPPPGMMGGPGYGPHGPYGGYGPHGPYGGYGYGPRY